MSKIVQTYIVPHVDIQERVDAFLSKYRGNKLIGMHIRCGNPLSDFKDQSSFLSLADISTFQHCVKDLKDSSKKVLIVASDSLRAKNLIRAYNPSSEVVFEERKAVHTMTNSFRETKLNQSRAAFVEMLILSRCDFFVGTVRSTYSLCAAAFRGSLPHLVGEKSKVCAIPKLVVFGLSACYKHASSLSYNNSLYHG